MARPASTYRAGRRNAWLHPRRAVKRRRLLAAFTHTFYGTGTYPEGDARNEMGLAESFEQTRAALSSEVVKRIWRAGSGIDADGAVHGFSYLMHASMPQKGMNGLPVPEKK